MKGLKDEAGAQLQNKPPTVRTDTVPYSRAMLWMGAPVGISCRKKFFFN